MNPTIKRLSLALFALIVIAPFQNCAPPQHSVESQEESSFSSSVKYSELDAQIFKPKCLSCHSVGSPDFTSHATLMAGNSVVAFNPGTSSLYHEVASFRMPVGNRLSAGEISAIETWIADGALADGAPALPAPTTLTAVAASMTEINLAWVDVASNEQGYRVERAASASGPFTLIATLAANSGTLVDAGLTGGTEYFYRVYAYTAAGNSQPSNVASATTPAVVITPPATPTGLAANAASSTSINLTWTDASNNETGFRVERAAAAAGPFSTIATLGANVATYSNTGLTASTAYHYRVIAFRTGAESVPSNVATATTPAVVIVAPAAPGSFTATAVSSTQINLAWTDASNNETGFRIERSVGNAAYTVHATVGANVTSYSDTGLTASTTYSYRIASTNSAGVTLGGTASATTQAPAVVAPGMPQNLAVTAASSSQINLTWVEGSGAETGFRVERGTAAAGPFAVVATLGANVTSYSNTGLSAGTTYYYRVQAYNTAGNSPYSTVASATTQAAAPSAPTGLTVMATSATQINLAWTDASNNETGFKIERASAAAGPYTVIASLGANVTSYSNTGLSAATTYFYRVSSSNASGDSAPTAAASTATFGTYSWLVTNVFQGRCISCHSGNGADGGYDMATYAKVLNRVSPNNSAGSKLYTEVQNNSMPDSGAALSAAQKNAIKTWIDSGALNN